MATKKTDSRTADKFVVRLPDGVRACIDNAASEMHTSMNAFVVQAIEEKLARGVRQELLLDALQSVLRDIAEYTGEGPATTPWRNIVASISKQARDALSAGEQA